MAIALNLIIIWFQTTVTIPLNHNLDDYKAVPYAILMVDGKEVFDDQMYYEYEVNRTFFSVISTKSLGSYRVDYKVYYPTYNKTAEHSIIFKIVDITPPTIIRSQDHYLPLGQKQYDLKIGLYYEDDYDKVSDLRVDIFQAESINVSVVGTYPIIYRITDKSGNFTEVRRNVYVYDHLPPTIEQKLPVILNPGELFEINKYFTIKDNYDKVLIINLDDSLVNYNRLGIYLATITAKDQSGNQTTTTFEVIIKDMIAPRIILIESKIQWQVKEMLTDAKILEYVYSVSDNYDYLTKDDLIITNLVNIEQVGNYEVILELWDSSRNSTKVILKVEVNDYLKPTIKGPDEIIIDVNTSEIHLIDYFIIDDNYTEYALLDIKFQGKYDLQKIGDYRLELSVTDLNRNKAIHQFKLLVLDRIPPVISQNMEIEIYDFKPRGLNNYFNVIDNYDSNPNLIIDDTLVNYNKVGKYPIFLTAIDSSNNQSHFQSFIHIIDQSIPRVSLTTNAIYVEVFSDPIDLFQYIESVFSEYDKNLSIKDVTIADKIDYNKIGRYVVIYQITSKQGLSSNEELIVIIHDQSTPVIKTTQEIIKVNKGDKINFEKYLTAIDNYDGDISDKIELVTRFNTQNPGIYELLFRVSDSSGNIGTCVLTVVVVEKQTKKLVNIGVIGGITIALVSALIIKYKSKPKVNF